jgi:hypothetical protein
MRREGGRVFFSLRVEGLEVGSGCESWGFVSLIVLFYGGGYCPDAGKLHLLHRIFQKGKG